VTWILIFVGALFLFFAFVAIVAAGGSSRDTRAEEAAGKHRRGADMCDYHVLQDEDGNEVLVTDPKDRGPAV
jgi:hypothetical protein